MLASENKPSESPNADISIDNYNFIYVYITIDKRDWKVPSEALNFLHLNLCQYLW